jgi:putative FmdB family regulatory protein
LHIYNIKVNKILEEEHKMPIFDYTCDDCKKDYEIMVRKNDDRAECTACGSSNVKRVYSTFDFNLKKSTTSTCQAGSCTGGSCGI